jgi:RNA recognition motif-containing protein
LVLKNGEYSRQDGAIVKFALPERIRAEVETLLSQVSTRSGGLAGRSSKAAKLFVGNLSFSVTENDLQDAFAAHGTVVEANLMMDRASGRARGFGFVTMSTPEEARNAADALNGKELGGRAMTVNLANPREDRSGGGGGAGGRGGYGRGSGRGGYTQS